jgi:alpha-beta hydrolase superfamily lysophospholipase
VPEQGVGTQWLQFQEDWDCTCLRMASQYHYVLLHGGCYGAWAWFTIEARLQKAGHQVTAMDFAGAGIHPAEPNQIATFDEYHKPALDFFESLPENPEEKVSSACQIPVHVKFQL